MTSITRSPFTFLFLALAGCAHKEPTITWDGPAVRQQYAGSVRYQHAAVRAGRASGTRLAAVVDAYDMGRLPNEEGGMDEAHRYYHIAQDSTWDTRLPKSLYATNGVHGLYHPPNYQRVPPSQRLQELQEETSDAKRKLEEQLGKANELRGLLEQKLQEAGSFAAAKQELESKLEAAEARANELQRRLEAIEAKPSSTPTPKGNEPF